MGRVIRAHRKAARKGPAVGTALPVRSIPVGSVVSNVERRVGGRGVFATASGDHAVVISHSPGNDTTRVYDLDHPPGIRPALIVCRITPTLRGQAVASVAAIAAAA